jgi:RES domain-containing protein
MLAEPQLVAALANLAGARRTGVGFRVIDYEALHGFHSPAPYSPNPLYNLGAAIRGGRYTPKGGPPSLYFALDPTTALHESWQIDVAQLQAQGANPTHLSPVVTVTIGFHLTAVLDLCDPAVQVALGTNINELQAAWRPVQIRGGVAPTQLLGQLAEASVQWQGMLYPSSKATGACIVAFTDRFVGNDFIEVNDPLGNLNGRLP